MTIIIKSDNKATVHMGNVNGIKGPQDWAMFLDFENEVYSTKQGGVLKKNYTIDEVVEASRSNLNGSPITISKSGVERVVTSTTEVRTALLKNGRFGLLVEDLNQNFFLNSRTPVTQSIILPASIVGIVASCEGSGSLTITGDVVGSPVVVTSSAPVIMARKNSNLPCNLHVAVNGSPSHVQIELATGMQTATSKITTDASSRVRAREFVKVNPDLFSSLISNKDSFTVLVQTIDYNPVLNQETGSICQRLTLLSGTDLKIMRASGIHSNLQVSSLSYKYTGSTLINPQQTLAGFWNSQNRFVARNQACTLDGSTLRGAFNGLAENTLDINNPFFVDEIGFGYGYNSPIGVNGLRGIVTKFLAYDRVMSQVEITELTKSWI